MRLALRYALILISFFTLTEGMIAPLWAAPAAQTRSSAEIMPNLDWTDVIKTMDDKLKEDNKTLRDVISRIKSSKDPFTLNTLQTLVAEVKIIKDDTSGIVTQLQTYDSTVQSALEILGPKSETAHEDSSISRQRVDAQNASNTIKTLNVKARFYELQANSLLNELDTLRHKLQHDTLSHRSASPLSLTYWHNFMEELPLHPFSLFKNHSLEQSGLLLTSTFLILLIAASGGLFLRRRLIRVLVRWMDHELLDNKVAHRLIHCLCGALLGGLAFLLWIGWSTIFGTDSNTTEEAIGRTLPVCAFILGAGLPLHFIIDGKSNRKASILLTLAILCDTLISTLKVQAISVPTIVAFLEAILSLITLGCCFAIIPRPSAPKAEEDQDGEEAVTHASTGAANSSATFLESSSRILWIILLIYTLLNAGWVLTGYSMLAFTANMTLISLFYAISVTGCFVGAWQAFVALIFSPHALPGRHLLRIGITRRRLDFFNVLISALGSLMFLLLFIALLTNGGEFTPAGIINRLHHVFSGSTFHGVAFSPETLLGGSLLIVSAYYIIKGIRFWLTKKFFPTTTLAMGLRTSILSILTYCGWIIVGIILLSLVGLSVQNLTWVVSALSVGVGFGLQSIVKDFISGLILLAERPIEAGDVIEVGGNRGEVKRVNVRTTDIRLGDGSTLIVPNSQFITSNVKNASFGNVPAKLTLSFTLPVNSELQQVRALIMQAVEKQKSDILSYPAPGITLSALNDLTLSLSLAVYVTTPGKMGGVKNTLASDIFELFQKARIVLTMS